MAEGNVMNTMIFDDGRIERLKEFLTPDELYNDLIERLKFLDDKATYLGNQVECEFGGDRCFGIAANMDFILICTYEKDGENPELVLYKKR